MNFEKLLLKGDLRTIGDNNIIVRLVQNQNDFDELFKFLFHKNRLVVMRAADAVEKITIHSPQYLDKHKSEIFSISETASNKELQWHLAQFLPRITINENEFTNAWKILMRWTKDKNNSKIVRVNSMQALFELNKQNKKFAKDFQKLISELEKENIPSIKARIKKLKGVSGIPAVNPPKGKKNKFISYRLLFLQ